MTYSPIGWADGSGGGTPIDAANLAHMDAGIAAAVPLDGSVGMTAPLKLASGHQETNGTGMQTYSPSGAQFFAIYTRFRNAMTNTPSSITLAGDIGVVNATSVVSTFITTTGFLLQWAASAAGQTTWIGHYTTVGNCLLAVDAQAQTFDHHCDACGHVHRAVALTALHAAADYGGLSGAHALAYTCPDCGAVEAFDTRMTAADESDPTPQGAGEFVTTRGAQAVMIRALLRLLGLPVAD